MKKESMTSRVRLGDTMVRTTTETLVESGVIDYDDILDATKVLNDDDYTPPWKDFDGYEHTVTPDKSDGNAAGYFYGGRNSRYRGPYMVVLTRPDSWGNYAYHRARGASKQVAYELTRKEWKRTLKVIAGWYDRGWNRFYVACRFKEANESVGGIYCSEPTTKADDESLEATRHEIASQAAFYLEGLGYTVTNLPDFKYDARKANLETLRHNLNSQNHE